MGNSKSNLPAKIDHHIEAHGFEIYQLIGRKGEGKLVDLVKKANRTKNFVELDECIRTDVKAFLYNDGEGKMVYIKILFILNVNFD